ncbi:MAG: exodeoxyribonuclease III [Methylococcaceae bacterium]|nr:exodeoxyribonuclease III [Methylococcaceae bacterium]
MRISTWNVNGLRSSVSSGFETWLADSNNDIVCLQEVKMKEDLFTKSWFDNYDTFFNSANRAGYSGVATLIKHSLMPISVERGIDDLTDNEGRVLATEFTSFILVNVYAPHSHRQLTRLEQKLSFCRQLLNYLKKLRKRGKPLIVAGDLNVAHHDIDLSNPKGNRKNAGFLPEEREWFDSLLNEGFVDAFRIFENNGGHFTWWSMRKGVRERNIGWRLDYVLVDETIKPRVISCHHSPNQRGSDHCPVTVEIDI